MDKKKVWLAIAIVAGIGGAVHLLQGFFSYNLLQFAGSWSSIVQGIAGAATLLFVGKEIL